MLVEQVDLLSRLTTPDWTKLKAELTALHVRVVALDLPTSWMMATNNADEFTGLMFLKPEIDTHGPSRPKRLDHVAAADRPVALWRDAPEAKAYPASRAVA